MHTHTDVLSVTVLREHHRQTLWLRAMLALVGIALIPAFMVGEAGFPDVTPSTWGVALVVGVNGLFCAFATALVYTWLIRDHVRDLYLRIGLSAITAGIFGFFQVFVLLLALIFWPFWLLAMLAILMVTGLQLLFSRGR